MYFAGVSVPLFVFVPVSAGVLADGGVRNCAGVHTGVRYCAGVCISPGVLAGVCAGVH